MGWVQKIELKPDRRGRVGHSYRAGFRDPDGRVQTKQFRRAHDAQRWLRDQETALHRGEYVDPALGRETFGSFFEHTIRTSDLRPKTAFDYRFLMRRHVLDPDRTPCWDARPLNTIRPGDVKELLAAVGGRPGAGPATVNAVYRVLRRTLQIAVDEGRIGRNPAARLKVPRPTRRPIRALSPDQLAALAGAVEARHRALILVLGYGGLRIGEASALRIGDVDVARGRLTISRAAVEVDGKLMLGPTKSGRVRTVELPAFVRQVLVEHLERFSDPKDPEALVFTLEHGRAIRSSTFGRRVLRPAAITAGISPPPATHHLRHTAVAIAISAGWHPKAIQELVGHSSIQVTLDVYGHLFETLQSASLERLDAIARTAKPPSTAKVIPVSTRRARTSPARG